MHSCGIIRCESCVWCSAVAPQSGKVQTYWTERDVTYLMKTSLRRPVCGCLACQKRYPCNSHRVRFIPGGCTQESDAPVCGKKKYTIKQTAGFGLKYWSDFISFRKVSQIFECEFSSLPLSRNFGSHFYFIMPQKWSIDPVCFLWFGQIPYLLLPEEWL